jgi:hypothetical protein
MERYVEQRDGGYYIAGTRISLDSVVHAFRNGASPETILRSFPLIGSLEKRSLFTWRIWIWSKIIFAVRTDYRKKWPLNSRPFRRL